MQPFFVQPPQSSVVVELDRCPRCTRLWFDVRELERASGKAFLPRLKGAAATHGCPVCKTPMATSLIRGEVPVEECETCSGALLDAHDFEAISGKPLQQVSPPKPKPPPPAPGVQKSTPARTRRTTQSRVVEFTCERCRARTPVSQAGTINGATVCRSCEAKPWPNQPTWYGSRSSALDDLGDALDEFFTGFFKWD